MAADTRVVVPFVAAATVGLAGCSESEGGTAEPESAKLPGPATSTGDSPSTDGSSTTPLSGLDPCSLLNTSAVEKHGPVEEPVQERIGSSEACTWHPDRQGTAADMPAFLVGLRENGGVADMNDLGQGVQRAELNGREVARVPSPGGCSIAIGVTDKSRVDVQVTGVDTELACDMVDELAQLVEPRIPSD